MAPVVVIAVVDADPTRRVSLVGALRSPGIDTIGVPGAQQLDRLPLRPTVLLVVAGSRTELGQQRSAIEAGRALGQLPWLVMTVGAGVEALSAAEVFALGAIDLVREPVDRDELRARIVARSPKALELTQPPARDQAEAGPEPTEIERYLEIFRAASDGMVALSFDGAVLYCNPAACTLTGRSVEALRGSRWIELVAADGRERFAEARVALARGEVPANVDLPLRTPAGERRLLNVSFSAVMPEQRGIIVTLRDVTDERALARELTKTKEFLERVIDSSVDAIVSADMAGEVLLFNPAAEQIYGYRADAVVGKMNVRALYPGNTAYEIMQQIRSAECGGPGVLRGFETRLLLADGSEMPALLSAALIVHRGRAIGSVGVFEDLRAERSFQERLAEAEARLRAHEKKAFVAELAGATAHELNQPLTTVMGYSQMLARQLDPETDLRRAADRIVTETERMADIVRKIGKLTRYESKAYVGDTKIIDIERSVDSEPPVTGR